MTRRSGISDESIARLNNVARSMPRIWEEMDARGYQLPRLFIDELRSLQVQDPDLKPSSYYLAEVIKERVGIFYWTWMVSNRPSGDDGTYRSAYIDLLEKRIKGGAWPELGKARQHTVRTHDPALMRYMELPIADNRHWHALLDRYRTQVDAEAAISTRYSSLWSTSRDVSPQRTKKIMGVVLNDVGFSPRLNIPRGGIVFTRALRTPDVFITCSLGDAHQMKHGLWSLGIGFCSLRDSLDKFAYDARLITEGFSFWLRGGDWYLRHEGSPSRVVLGITVCAALADLLAQAFDRD